MKQLHHDENGKFCSPNSKPLAKKVIGVRLPVDVDEAVRKLAGNELSNWVRQAVIEKYEREQQISA